MLASLKSLKILDIGGTCGVSQKDIVGLDLTALYAQNNHKITDVSFMKSLRILNASCYCGIDQNGISGVDLLELDSYYNSKITTKSFKNN
jgi:hypothetical protein